MYKVDEFFVKILMKCSEIFTKKNLENLQLYWGGSCIRTSSWQGALRVEGKIIIGIFFLKIFKITNAANDSIVLVAQKSVKN